MNRNKEIVLIPHCFLNQNCVVKNEARNQDIFMKILFKIQDTSFIQMECPEYNVFGLNREGVGKNELDSDLKYVDWCEVYCDKLINEIKNYLENGCKIKNIIGIKGSPSCGIEVTCYKNQGGFYTDKGIGKFNEILMKRLKKENLEIEFIELD
ncbi:MAG: hypothetical protein ACK5K7_01200 [Bacilli bacterium]